MSGLLTREAFLLEVRSAALDELGPEFDRSCAVISIATQRLVRDFLRQRLTLASNDRHMWCETADGRVIDLQARPVPLLWARRPAGYVSQPAAHSFTEELRRDGWPHLEAVSHTTDPELKAQRIVTHVVAWVAERGSWGLVAEALLSPRAEAYRPALAEAVLRRPELADLRGLAGVWSASQRLLERARGASEGEVVGYGGGTRWTIRR